MMSNPRLPPLPGWMRLIAPRCAGVLRRVSPRAAWPRTTLLFTKSSSPRNISPGCGLSPEEHAAGGLLFGAVSVFALRRNRFHFWAKHGVWNGPGRLFEKGQRRPLPAFGLSRNSDYSQTNLGESRINDGRFITFIISRFFGNRTLCL